MKTLRRFFAGEAGLAKAACARQTEAFQAARPLVRIHYFFLLFLASNHLPAWEQFFVRMQMAPLWPVEWLSFVDYRLGVNSLMVLGTVGAMAAAFLPERRWARMLAFAGFFEYVALVNSFGKIGHSLHAWVLSSFLLIFLPDIALRSATVRRVTRQQFLNVIWALQAVFLLTYTMAGLGKVAGAIYQGAVGEVQAFAPQAMQLHIADRLLQTGSKSLIGSWMIDHPYVIYPLMLGTLYLQIFSFWVAFRPAIQRWWALGLIVFHVMSFYTLTIIFPQNVFLLCLLFCYPPLQARAASWWDMARALPLFGDGWTWWERRRKRS